MQSVGKLRALWLVLAAAAAVLAVAAYGLLVASKGADAQVHTATQSGAVASPVVDVRSSKLIPSLSKLKADRPVTYKNGCHLRPGQAKPKVCTYGNKKAKKRVLLFGDSHAASWFGAADRVSKSRKYRLLNLTKSSCSSVPNTGTSDCRKWRNASLKNIRQGKYGRIDVTIISNMAPAQKLSAAMQRNYQTGLNKTLKALASRSKQIIVLRDQPGLPVGSKFASCLRVNIKKPRECGAPLSKSVSPATWAVEKKVVAKYKQARAVDLTSGVCTGGFCSPVKGRYIVMRDDHHFSQTFVRKALYKKLDPQLRAAIRRAR